MFDETLGTDLFNTPENDSDQDSDDNSRLVIECSTPKKRTSLEPTPLEKKIIEGIEEELEKRLEEKASKSNLNVINVKSIIRQIVTNKNVLALVRKAEDPDFEEDFEPEYEPKLTRAKAKELLSTPLAVPITPVCWSTPRKTKPSEVQVLLTEELQDDESGDDEDFIPYYEKQTGQGIEKDESEDDKDSSICSSNPPSVPPPTPPTPTPQDFIDAPTALSEDGVFKVPLPKPSDPPEDTNIAKRTRSKLCLTSTPLEKIEESFVPPDITTDMYDMDCDNDDWMDFLKKFTRPLDEIVKSNEQEDEEQDPEYNILADEELDEIDKEELRMDKAVKISKKELNNLIAELFEYTDGFCQMARDIEQDDTLNEENTTVIEEIVIETDQYLLLEQQLRQHVQMLTQNFILTYQHPEWNEIAFQFKEFLLNFKFLSEGKERSAFYTLNLKGALNFIEDWEAAFEKNDKEIRKVKQHVMKTIATSIDRKRVGSEFIGTFPPFMLEKMSKSEVFLYPALLPKIPFKSPRILNNMLISSTAAEDGLIAFGLEEFFEFLQEEKKNISKNSKQHLLSVCDYISEYMITYKTSKCLMNVIRNRRLNKCAMNPIRYYFMNNRSFPIVQHVTPLDKLVILPPCRRKPEELPFQWRTFVDPVAETVFAHGFEADATILTPVNNVFSVVNIEPVNQSSPIPLNVSIVTTEGINLGIQNLCNKSYIPSNVPEIGYQYSERFILPKGPIPPDNQQISNSTSKQKKRKRIKKTKKSVTTPLKNLIRCICDASQISKLSSIFSFDNSNLSELLEQIESNVQQVNNPDRFSEFRKQILLTPINETQFDSLINNIANCDTDMLPSMPHLGTPFKQYTNQSNLDLTSTESVKIELTNSLDGQDVSKTEESQLHNFNLSNLEPSCSREQGTLQERDDQNDINALLIASSTVKPTGRKEPSGAEKKRAKLKREFLANLMVSTPEDPEVQKKKSEMFALSYYDKMRETLELDDYHKVMQILNDYQEGDAVGLYQKVEKVLRPKYLELADEFLLFLREKEAAAVSQLIPWIRMNNRSKFLRKLEIYFKDQPAQLRKIYKCLTELSQDTNISIEKIKNTLLPMFKGNGVLSDLFLQNFLGEQPPPSLLDGPYESIDVKKETVMLDDDTYETLVIPEVEDNYGNPSCICNCHHIEDPEFKSRFRHCIRCGTKFVKGNVYIQTGRGLRPATVSFNNPNVDHNVRLFGSSLSTNRQRKGLLRQMVFSPTKENLEEDSDDDGDRQKRKKNSPGRRRKQTLSESTSRSKQHDSHSKSSADLGKNESSPTKKGYKSVSKKNKYSVKRSKISKKCLSENEKCDADDEDKQKEDIYKPGSTEGQVKRFVDESSECEESVTTQDSNDNLKSNSPEHQTAESESECCEESSQDNCESDSNSSTSSCNNQSQSDSNAGDEDSWTRTEDKLILETFKRENHKERAFELIAKKMKHRTIAQIRSRFNTLMGMLMEMMVKEC